MLEDFAKHGRWGTSLPLAVRGALAYVGVPAAQGRSRAVYGTLEPISKCLSRFA